MSATDVGGIQFFKPIWLCLEKKRLFIKLFLTFSCYIKNIFTIFALDFHSHNLVEGTPPQCVPNSKGSQKSTPC